VAQSPSASLNGLPAAPLNSVSPATGVAAAVPPPSTSAVSSAAPEGSLASSAPLPEPPAGDEELHRKARRFAKLLVDEIKLYNQSKVAEGKLNHDLYDRLKDDIDKSRTTYDKRYAQTSVAGFDYFIQELIRNLADGNPILLGSNFPR
jgi:hypothetical protein